MTGQDLILRPEQPVAVPVTSARTDEEFVALWVRLKGSPHTRRNFETTAKAFLEKLGRPLQGATLEDVLSALVALCEGLSAGTARQYTLRVKSLLSFAVNVSYLPANLGAPISAPLAPRSLAKRILDEVDVDLLIGSSASDRDYLLAEVGYATGARVSELVGLSVGDVIQREIDGKPRVQLSIIGKGQKLREVLLPNYLTRPLLALCAGRPPEAAVFLSRRGNRLTASGAWRLVKRLAAKAGVNPAASPHWLRHAHISHALDNNAPIATVQTTVGHESLATTTAYVHARPNTASGDYLRRGRRRAAIAPAD